MEPALTWTGILLTACYTLFILSIIYGIKRLKPGTGERTPRVTVVVAARNEQENIADCLAALLSQDYPRHLIEFIIVNDRSEDGTPAVVETHRERDARITLIDVENVPEGVSPKKHALTLGIRAASGEIICTTDADCVPPPAWVSAMVRYFGEEVGLVAGFSPLIVRNGNPFFANFRYIDSLSLAVVAAGGIGTGTGWTCAGRNLAYRKAVFEEVDGFAGVEHQVSGDDDLLMHRVLAATGWKLRYAAGTQVTVPSYVDHGWRAYVQQRTRHASKFRVYPLRVQATAFAVFLFYAAVWLYPAYMLAAREFLPVYALMLGVKFAAELTAVSIGARALEGRFSFGSFLRAFFVHPLMIVVFSVLGMRGRFSWKGREFRQR